ncbi:hypothetical protein ACWGAN_17780 [Streptomyces sp. NPDC054945]
MRDLAGYTITVNGTQLPLDVPAAIHACRTALNPAARWSTALTQGDPTEPDIVSTAAALPAGRELEALRPNVSFITAQSSTIDGGWMPH